MAGQGVHAGMKPFMKWTPGFKYFDKVIYMWSPFLIRHLSDHLLSSIFWGGETGVDVVQRSLVFSNGHRYMSWKVQNWYEDFLDSIYCSIRSINMTIYTAAFLLWLKLLLCSYICRVPQHKCHNINCGRLKFVCLKKKFVCLKSDTAVFRA